MSRSIDSRLDFLSPVSLVPGLGAKRVNALHESGIDTIGDLLHYFPLRYIDRSTITKISDLQTNRNKVCTIIGDITQTRVVRGRTMRLRILVADETGSVEALWFHGVQFFRKSLHTGMRVLCTGAVKFSEACDSKPLMFHPMIETINRDLKSPETPFLPRYPLTRAMIDAHFQQKGLFKSIKWVIDNINHWPQSLPQSMENKKQFPPLSTCLREMHMPSDLNRRHIYEARIIFEELYALAVTLLWSRKKFAQPGRSFKKRRLVDAFKSLLPFSLTSAQNSAIETLLSDAQSPFRMHRLLQGDVGSGKTVAAFMACLPSLDEGWQTAWLAPTEALARQTFSTLSQWCEKLGISTGLLTGGLSGTQKKKMLDDCSSGRLGLVVGTHALLYPQVGFKRLGMIIIDEQHKFGAKQRLAMQEKDPAADFLLMSATPIPQTLARTLYGDLDIVSIKDMPAGRIPVNTCYVPREKRFDMENFINSEILNNGAQVYYVVPHIETDEDSDNIKGALSVFDSLSRGIFSKAPCGLVHGRMDSSEQQRTMDGFKNNKIKLLVATTIVEVGLDVPSATIIVIENAERLGLAQLHQLRGRVGRSSKKSYCFLLSDNPSDAAKARIDYFRKHHDGFEIAENDMLLRGPGEVLGWRQAGPDDLYIADILRDASVFQEIINDLEKGFRTVSTNI
ncbi:MAG TPA: hypothetical protein DCO75_11610 [Fibrobacteres bacterium]|nr:hypothetical protein [Fibrobacterota bacterium]